MSLSEFLLLISIMGILVIEFSSSGYRKKRPRMGTCPAGYWQNQAQWEAHQNRVNVEKSHRHETEMKAYYERELKKRERAISRLRSLLEIRD